MKGQRVRAGYGKQVGGGTRFPKATYTVVSSSSRAVEGKPGALKLPGTLPFSGSKGK